MRKVLAVLGVLVVAACGGGDDSGGSGDVALCEEAFAEGAPVDGARAASDEGCDEGDGSIRLLGMAILACDDGRELIYNDEGWAYSDGEWHRHDREDGQLVPPDDEMAAC